MLIQIHKQNGHFTESERGFNSNDFKSGFGKLNIISDEVQICIWPRCCHCHSLYLASVESSSGVTKAMLTSVTGV